MPYACTNSGLDQYETLDLNQKLPPSLVHMTPTNPKVEVSDNTRYAITTKSPQKTTCKLSNVKGKLNFKHNDTLSQLITNSLNIFVDVYKSLENTKMVITKKYFPIAVQMHYKKQTFQPWLHELDTQAKGRAKDLIIQLFRMKIKVGSSNKQHKRQEEDDVFDVLNGLV